MSSASANTSLGVSLRAGWRLMTEAIKELTVEALFIKSFKTQQHKNQRNAKQSKTTTTNITTTKRKERQEKLIQK